MSSDKLKHPKGLYYLFFTEMWERFGYYLMIGIFVLYMTDYDKGGLNMDRDMAADIFGTFIALNYLTPFIGGMIADKLLGYRKSIILGGTLMGLGYLGLAIPGQTAFYTAIVLIILGNGFFKPNISTILGNLYSEPKYKSMKDSGYSIFYMGINIGAFICNFFAAFLRNSYGWGEAFAAAGIGMFLGIAVFIFGNKHYAHVDVIKPKNENDASVAKVLSQVLLPAVIIGIIGWKIPGNIFGSDSSDAFLLGAIPVVAFYASLYFKAEAHEKKPVGALLSIFAVVVIFWAVFKQNGTALTTWAQYYTDRETPAAVEGFGDALKLNEEVTYTKDSSFVIDPQFRKVKDAQGEPIKNLVYPAYFINDNAAHKTEGTQLKLISTELFQSINPFFVVMLTPLAVGFFSFLRSRKKEPSTPAKICWGLFISGISTLIMVLAVYACGNGAMKASPMWLVESYAIVTVGELFLSPMGLSLVSKLSPPRITAMMMGGWSLATSLGNKLSGILAKMWDGYEDKANYFYVNFALLMFATLLLFLMLKRLNKIFKEYGA
jgi:POT family proton-dependent oligopeptide transporter